MDYGKTVKTVKTMMWFMWFMWLNRLTQNYKQSIITIQTYNNVAPKVAWAISLTIIQRLICFWLIFVLNSLNDIVLSFSG